jgi:threonine dehydrogenase-like Zn-dependent dehydrogenase
MTQAVATVQALTFRGPGIAEVGPRSAPAAAPGITLVAPRFAGICATDIELRDGTHPYFSMGVARYPLQPGHEWAGVVVESDDPRFSPGTPVVADPEVSCGRPDCEFCTAGRIPWCPDRQEIGCRGHLDGAAAELVAIPTRNLHRVPDGVDLRDAVLAEPAATVFGGLHRVGPIDGRRALVIGAGTIGLIAAQVMRAQGAEVTVAVRRRGRETALAGFETIVVEDAAHDPLPAGFPVVMNAAGSASAITLGLRALANGGQLALLGVPAEPVDHVDVASILHKDATIHGVLNVSSGGPALFDRALDALAKRVIDGSVVIDTVIPFADADAALTRVDATDRARPKVLLGITA